MGEVSLAFFFYLFIQNFFFLVKIPFGVFAEFVKEHVELSELLERFDILPTIEKERKTILEVMSEHTELKLGDLW